MEEEKQEETDPKEADPQDKSSSNSQDTSPSNSQPSSQPSSSATVILTRLIAFAGHVAFRQMVHLDTFVFGELKRRRAIQEQKKDMKTPKSDRRGSKVVGKKSQWRQWFYSLWNIFFIIHQEYLNTIIVAVEQSEICFNYIVTAKKKLIAIFFKRTRARLRPLRMNWVWLELLRKMRMQSTSVKCVMWRLLQVMWKWSHEVCVVEEIAKWCGIWEFFGISDIRCSLALW